MDFSTIFDTKKRGRPWLPCQTAFPKFSNPKKGAFLAAYATIGEKWAAEGKEPFLGVLSLLKKARRQSSGKAAKKQVWGPAG